MKSSASSLFVSDFTHSKRRRPKKMNEHLEELVSERTAELSAEIAIRKRSENQVKRLNRVYAVLSNINQAIVRIHDVDQLLKDVCLIAVNEGKFQSAWVGLENSETKEIETFATAGIANELFQVSPEDNPIVNALRSGKHYVSNNITAENSLTNIWKENSLSLGFQSFAVFPLKVLEKVVGGFSIYSNEPDFFDDREISLIDEVAMDISFALEFIQKESKRKRAEKALQASELKYRRLFDDDLTGDYITSVDGTILLGNQALAKIFGFHSIDELINENIYSFYKDPNNQDQLLKVICEKKKIENYEREFTLRDGRVISVIENIIGEFGENGELVRLKGYLFDNIERKRAEEELRAIHSRQEAILSAVPDIIMEVDKNKVYTWTNQFGIEFFGKDVIGKEATFYFEGEQETYNIVQPLFGGSENIIYVESWQRRKDGEKRLLAWWCRALKDESGNIIGALSSAQDITERKQAEKEREVIYAIGEAINTTVDFNEFLQSIYENIKKVMYAENCYIALDDASTKTISFPLFVDQFDSTPTPRAKRKGLSEYVLRIAKPLLLTPKLIDELIKDREVELIGTPPKSWLGVPLFVQSKPIGVLVVQSYEPGKTYTDKEKDILTMIGHQVATAIERKHAEKQLRESEERMRDIIFSAGDWIWEVDENWRYIYSSNKCEELFGYTPEEVLGKTPFDFMPPDEVERVKKIYFGVIFNKALLKDLENWKTGKNGERICLLTNGVHVLDEDGNIKGYRGVDKDITERKLTEHARKGAEEALQKSQQKLKELFETAPVGYHEINEHGNISTVNQTELKMLGYSYEEMIGRPVWEFFFDREDSRKRVLAKLAGNLPPNKNSEQLITHRGGTTLPVLVDDLILRNEEGAITGIRTTILDITERKQAEESLLRSTEFNESLLRTIPFGMEIVDEQGTILSLSYSMEKMIGIDAVGKKCWSIYKDDRKQCLDCPLRNGIAFDKPEVLELVDVLGGRIFQIHHIGMVYQGKKAMLEVFVEVTEQRRLQNQFLQSQKIQSIGTLAGGIAHDFNNILGIILAYSSLLERGAADKKKIIESSTAINKAVQRGAGLVRQILTFARQTDVSFQPLSIPDFIREMISMMEETFSRMIEIKKIIEGKIPAINADHAQMHQAVLNLCVNARDAMPKGGTLTVKVNTVEHSIVSQRFPAASAEWYVCISVADTGTGMDEKTKSRIFDPFFTTKEKGKGTGLGLAVVYGVMQTHHGFVDVESKEGKGTTFFLYLPVPTDPEAVQRMAEGESSDVPGGTETILIAEDEEVLRMMLLDILESHGYKVNLAEDGLEAVEIYRKHRGEIDLVLTDVGLPKITGIEEFERLREINPHVKVLFSSGYFEPDLKSEMYKAGAKGFIQKPYKPDDVLRKIREVLDAE